MNFELAIIEEMPELKEILQDKFSSVAVELQKVVKIASKGNRKGMVIFKPKPDRLIATIEDKFVQYIVRSIYDEFRDSVNGTRHFFHFNEMFNGDFVKYVFRKMNTFIDQLEVEYKAMREKHIHNEELSALNSLIHEKYQIFLSSRRNQNVFNASNPYSAPYFTKYNALKASVKALHPRVQDDKMDAYIDNDYTFRQEKAKIEKEHCETFTEYNETKARINEIYDIQHHNENVLRERLESEYKAMDYKKISGALRKMVDHFVSVVVTSLLQGTMKI